MVSHERAWIPVPAPAMHTMKGIPLETGDPFALRYPKSRSDQAGQTSAAERL